MKNSFFLKILIISVFLGACTQGGVAGNAPVDLSGGDVDSVEFVESEGELGVPGNPSAGAGDLVARETTVNSGTIPVISSTSGSVERNLLVLGVKVRLADPEMRLQGKYLCAMVQVWDARTGEYQALAEQELFYHVKVQDKQFGGWSKLAKCSTGEAVDLSQVQLSEGILSGNDKNLPQKPINPHPELEDPREVRVSRPKFAVKVAIGFFGEIKTEGEGLKHKAFALTVRYRNPEGQVFEGRHSELKSDPVDVFEWIDPFILSPVEPD